ncbi:MAG: ABC-three component system protein [Planctomycetota bacterium]
MSSRSHDAGFDSRLLVSQAGVTSPLTLVRAYSPGEWELFVQEAVDSQSDYTRVVKIAGSGDKGRDVCAELSSGEWDNFQCKAYRQALTPSDIWVELGKLFHYVSVGDFTMPRTYLFACPFDVGPKLHDLLSSPDRLREGLIEAWPAHCASKILTSDTIPLSSDLLTLIRSTSFSIFSYIPTLTLIRYSLCSPFASTRFHIELPPRSDPDIPPEELQGHEHRYVAKLFAAYGDACGTSAFSASDLDSRPHLGSHFVRAREAFYSAASLERFSEESAPVGAFTSLKHAVFAGVVDVAESPHANGLDCVRATTRAAQELQLSDQVLEPRTRVTDRHGVCHHLANEDQLDWCTPRDLKSGGT